MMELTPSGSIYPMGREDAMFCTNCGNELKPGMRFCTRCGAPVAHPEPVPIEAPSSPQDAPQPHTDPKTAALDRSSTAPDRTVDTTSEPPNTAPHPPIPPATADMPGAQTAPKKNPRRGAIVAIAAIVLIAVIVVACILLLGKHPTEVRFGQDESVPVARATRIIPHDVADEPITLYSASLVNPDAGQDDPQSKLETTPYCLNVDGPGGFTMADFGDDLPQGSYVLYIVNETTSDGTGDTSASQVPQQLPVEYEPDNQDAETDIVVAPDPDADAQTPQPTAYELYWQKCQDYIAQVGEPAWTTSGALSTNMMTGLCFAQLIDFNGDGTEELVVVYNTHPTFIEGVDGYLEQQVDAFAVEVWAYRDGAIDLVFNEPGVLEKLDGGYACFTTYLHDGVLELSTCTYGESPHAAEGQPSMTLRYYAFDGTTFAPTLTLDYIYEDQGYRCFHDDREIDEEEIADLTAGIEQSSRHLVLSARGGTDQLDETLELTQQTLDFLREASGAIDPDAETDAESAPAAGSPAYTVQEHEETSSLASSQGPGLEFDQEVIWRYSEICVEDGDAPAGVAVINDFLRTRVEERRRQAEAWTFDSGEEQDHGYAADIVSIQDGVASVRTDTYGFYGGAHGTRFVSGMFFDLETGEQLSATEALGMSENDLRAATVDALETFFSTTDGHFLDTDTAIEETSRTLAAQATERSYYRCEDGIVYVLEEGAAGPTSFGAHDVLIVDSNGASAGSDLTRDSTLVL